MTTGPEEININEDTTVPTIALLIMRQMNIDASFTLNALVEGYKRDAERLQATVDLIRQGINNAYCKPYAPSQNTILNCLWPYEDDIDNYIKGERHGRGAA